MNYHLHCALTLKLLSSKYSFCTFVFCLDLGLLNFGTFGLLDIGTFGLLDFGILDFGTLGLVDFWTLGLLGF